MADVVFGVTRVGGALIASVETNDKIEVKQLKGSNGVTARVKAIDPTTDFTVKGHGNCNVGAPGVGNSGISGVGGGVTVITSVKNSESNEQFSSWEYSGTVFPNAQQV